MHVHPFNVPHVHPSNAPLYTHPMFPCTPIQCPLVHPSNALHVHPSNAPMHTHPMSPMYTHPMPSMYTHPMPSMYTHPMPPCTPSNAFNAHAPIQCPYVHSSYVPHAHTPIQCPLCTLIQSHGMIISVLWWSVVSCPICCCTHMKLHRVRDTF